MKVGFTGTQRGLSHLQRLNLRDYLTKLSNQNELAEAHHGDCMGADAGFHEEVQMLNGYTVIHPPDRNGKRAFCKGDETLGVQPYLVRNHAIVDATDILYACPDGGVEKLRSGTWSTIRYARKVGKPIVILFPDGSQTIEQR